jgi:hypothetical protein
VHALFQPLLTLSPCSLPCEAGKEATEAFYSLHRHEVLERPQYKRLQIGLIAGEKPTIRSYVPGMPSKVPYAEPTWLCEAYHSPYYTEVRFPLTASLVNRSTSRLPEP